MKKLYCIVLASIAMLLLSCGGQKSTNQNVELPEAKASVDASKPHWQNYHEPGELVWYINFDWYVPLSTESLVYKEIERLTGTTIILKKGNDDALNQMIASGQLPDLITVPNISTQFTKSADRWAVPLNQLADKYDPYFYKVANEDTIKWFTLDDGNIYGYPSFSNAAEHYEEGFLTGQDGFVVRKDIYEAIGSPDMRTPEGFLQALRDAKSYDPTIIAFTADNIRNGGGIFEALLNYLAVPKLVNDQYNERLYDEEYLRWMEVFRQAYAEGLIPDDEFTYSWDDFDGNVKMGRYFAILSDGINYLHGSFTRNNSRDKNQMYIAVDALSNQNFDTPRLMQNGISGWTSTYVTKQSKDKERAIALLTYLISEEGQELVRFGVKDKTFYRDEDGMYNWTPEALDLHQKNLDLFGDTYGIPDFWVLQHDRLNQKYARDADPSVAQINAWSRGKAYPYFILEESSPEPRSEEARIFTNYKNERNALAVSMIRAKSNAEMLEMVKQFKADMDKAGWQKVEKVINENIAKNKKKLEG